MNLSAKFNATTGFTLISRKCYYIFMHKFDPRKRGVLDDPKRFFFENRDEILGVKREV
jgi:hypothetical protein